MVIATVSPSSKDTEHTLNTLRHASIMDIRDSANAENVVVQQIAEINMSREVARLRAAKRNRLGGDFKDDFTSNGNEAGHRFGTDDAASAKEIRR